MASRNFLGIDDKEVTHYCIHYKDGTKCSDAEIGIPHDEVRAGIEYHDFDDKIDYVSVWDDEGNSY